MNNKIRCNNYNYWESKLDWDYSPMDAQHLFISDNVEENVDGLYEFLMEDFLGYTLQRVFKNIKVETYSIDNDVFGVVSFKHNKKAHKLTVKYNSVDVYFTEYYLNDNMIRTFGGCDNVYEIQENLDYIIDKFIFKS